MQNSNFRCPKCGSTLFHLKKRGSGIIVLCYRTNRCGWSITVKPE